MTVFIGTPGRADGGTEPIAVRQPTPTQLRQQRPQRQQGAVPSRPLSPTAAAQQPTPMQNRHQSPQRPSPVRSRPLSPPQLLPASPRTQDQHSPSQPRYPSPQQQ